jgi:hypothetical protein
MGRTKPPPTKGMSHGLFFSQPVGASELIFLELFEAAYLVDLGELKLFVEEKELSLQEVLELLLHHDARYVCFLIDSC